jgi:hypothetical protein
MSDAGNQDRLEAKLLASKRRLEVKNRIGCVVLVGLRMAMPSRAERPEPKVVATIGGEDVFQLLPVGAIPAIDDPEFVSGTDADRQMRSDEPVLGVVIGGEARAYSLWQLDAHEIVNDEIDGSAIAATW